MGTKIRVWRAGTVAPGFSLPALHGASPVSLAAFRGMPDPRRHDFVGRRILEEKPAGTGAQRLEDILVEPERGQDQYALSWKPPGGFDSIDHRHPDVH